MSKNNNNRVRCFSCVSYLPLNYFESVLLKKEYEIKSVCYCVHDKDRRKENTDELMPVHIHFVLLTYNGHTFTSVAKWFSGYVDSNGLEFNTFVQPLVSPDGAIAYLTHSDCDDNYHFKYSLEDLKGDTKRFIRDCYDDTDKSVLLLTELEKGVDYRILMQRYGREFILNYQKYIDCIGFLHSCKNFDRRLASLKSQDVDNIF